MHLSRRVAALAVVLLTTVAATASAENGAPPPGSGQPPPGQTGQPPQQGPPPIQIHVVAVHPDVAGVTVVLHCVAPELAGKQVMLTVGAGVDTALLVPGAKLMALADLQANVLAKVMPVPPGGSCGPQPGGGQPGQPGQPGGNQPGQPGGNQPGQPGQDGEQGGPKLDRNFINRVWKFRGSASDFDAGVLNITVEKILNLPKKFRDQDDELLDQDAFVLVSARVKIVDEDGKRVSASALADADSVQIEGKLLATAKWRSDEDDTPVTTIRAKRIRILS